MASPPPAHEVFISHAHADSDWVHGFLIPSLNLTEDEVLTREDFTDTTTLVDQYARAIDTCDHTILVLSPAFLADEWTLLAKDLATYVRVERQEGRLIPIQLQVTDDRLGLELRSLVRLDFSDPDDQDALVAQLREFLDQPIPVPEKIACPYPGMRAYKEHEAEAFFGREHEVEDLISLLETTSFLPVIGPSGSGKSSLVFAGLVPALDGSKALLGDTGIVLEMRPGAHPMDARTSIIRKDQPREPGPTFYDLLADPPEHLVLIVDQFEELYAVARDAAPDEVTPFQEALLQFSKTPGYTVVVTVSADFYADLMGSPLWPEIRNHRLEVLPLDEDELRSAINGPAASVGVYVEDVLVEQLVADAAGELGTLSLMQETLVYLWDGLRGRFIGVEAYEALGWMADPSLGECSGLEVAMALHANDVLHDLDPEQQPIARRTFLRLIQFGEGRSDTRRRQSIDQLRSEGDPPDLLDDTVRHLARGRLLTLGSSVSPGDATHGAPTVLVDIAHEALITGWPQLHSWVGTHKEAEKVRRRLEDKAEEWAGRDGQGGLLDEAELIDAYRWLANEDRALGTSTNVVQLIAASLDNEKARERSRYLGQAAGGAVGAGIGLGCAFGLGYWSLFPGSSSNVILLFALAIFPVGALVGLFIGIGIWLGRGSLLRRAVFTGAIGAITGATLYAIYVQFAFAPGIGIDSADLTNGALLGAGVGIPAGLTGPRQRFPAILVGSFSGVMLAYTFGTLAWDLPVAASAGLLLGVFTGAGFQATAAKRSALLSLPTALLKDVRNANDSSPHPVGSWAIRHAPRALAHAVRLVVSRLRPDRPPTAKQPGHGNTPAGG